MGDRNSGDTRPMSVCEKGLYDLIGPTFLSGREPPVSLLLSSHRIIISMGFSQRAATNPSCSEIMRSARVRRSGVARAWRCGLLTFSLAVGLNGCSAETYETRLTDVKTSLKNHGIEVHKGNVMRVFRF